MCRIIYNSDKQVGGTSGYLKWHRFTLPCPAPLCLLLMLKLSYLHRNSVQHLASSSPLWKFSSIFLRPKKKISRNDSTGIQYSCAQNQFLVQVYTKPVCNTILEYRMSPVTSILICTFVHPLSHIVLSDTRPLLQCWGFASWKMSSSSPNP